MKKYLLLCLIVLGSFGCSTDLEVNAPYKDITIIYGLLSTKNTDGTDETQHFVRINKAFLGDGNAFVYALIPDSNEYTSEQLQARVEEWDGNNMTNFWTLNDTIVPADPGTFNSPHKLYYFNAPLDPAKDYKVVCIAKGQTVSATSPIVNDFTISGPDQNPNTGISFMAAGTYSDFELNWISSADCRRFEASMRFNYAEVRGPDTTYKSFTRLMGTRVTANTNGGENLDVTMGGQDFFQGIANLVPQDPTVTKRIFLGIDLLFAVASDEFHTYLQLSEPISGIVEDRPDYTNVTNGYGLFASRYFKQVLGKKLSDPSLDELLNGPYTGSLLFCAAQSVGLPYGCQ